MHDDEKMQGSIQGLKYNMRDEVSKAQAESSEECAQIALNVQSAISRAREGSFYFKQLDFNKSVTTPMKIGNMQHGKLSKAQREKRKEDMENGARFRCHKVGCRPYMCCTKVSNVEGDTTNIGSLSKSKSEEEWILLR